VCLAGWKAVMKYLNESFQLVELEVKLLKALSEQVPQPILVHDVDEHAERLLLGHLTQTHITLYHLYEQYFNVVEFNINRTIRKSNGGFL